MPYLGHMTEMLNRGADVIPLWTTPDRLRKARENAGLEQSELAELMGVARNTVGNYEKGHTRPRKVVLRAWAQETGVPMWWLLGEDPRLGTRQEPTDYQMDVRLAA